MAGTQQNIAFTHPELGWTVATPWPNSLPGQETGWPHGYSIGGESGQNFARSFLKIFKSNQENGDSLTGQALLSQAQEQGGDTYSRIPIPAANLTDAIKKLEALAIDKTQSPIFLSQDEMAQLCGFLYYLRPLLKNPAAKNAAEAEAYGNLLQGFEFAKQPLLQNPNVRAGLIGVMAATAASVLVWFGTITIVTDTEEQQFATWKAGLLYQQPPLPDPTITNYAGFSLPFDPFQFLSRANQR
jgi:hypothetical protein